MRAFPPALPVVAGTLQMRVELDPAQQVSPVTQVAAVIQIQGDLFANPTQTKERSECLADSAALLVAVPRTP
jgi:hypothetical protein